MSISAITNRYDAPVQNVQPTAAVADNAGQAVTAVPPVQAAPGDEPPGIPQYNADPAETAQAVANYSVAAEAGFNVEEPDLSFSQINVAEIELDPVMAHVAGEEPDIAGAAQAVAYFNALTAADEAGAEPSVTEINVLELELDPVMAHIAGEPTTIAGPAM